MLTDFLADRTTIICSAAFDRYVRVGAVPAKKLELIPNGIDTRRFSPSAEAAREHAELPLAWGEISSGWRLAVWWSRRIIPVCCARSTMLPGSDWIVLIAGSGPLAESLQAECDALKLTDRVRFLGADENIWRLYNAADGFVMASDYEGLSIALLEAASMGLPAVVTNVGGNAEAVADGVTGYVVAPGDPARLAAAMESCRALPSEPGEPLDMPPASIVRKPSVSTRSSIDGSNSTADTCRIAQSASRDRGVHL